MSADDVDVNLLIGDVARARLQGEGVDWKQLSWEGIAKRAGISSSAIARLKRQEQPSLRTLIKLCRLVSQQPTRYIPSLRAMERAS